MSRLTHRTPSRRALRVSVGILVPLVLGLSGCGGERPADEAEGIDREGSEPDYASLSFPYDFDPAQKRAVGAFLERRDAWRLAVVSDNTNQLLGRMKRDEPDYQPYFAEGDIDGDGRDDFAIAVTNGSGTFRVIWFRDAGREYAPAQPVANVSWLDEAGLFIKDGDLLVGEFYTDRVQRYAWNPEARSLERQEVTGELRS